MIEMNVICTIGYCYGWHLSYNVATGGIFWLQTAQIAKLV